MSISINLKICHNSRSLRLWMLELYNILIFLINICNLISTTKFNDNLILITIISCDYLNLLYCSLANEYVVDRNLEGLSINIRQKNFTRNLEGLSINIRLKNFTRNLEGLSINITCEILLSNINR
jgi:hypothetical protein